MSSHPITDDALLDMIRDVKECGSINAAAVKRGISRSTLQHHMRAARERFPGVVPTAEPVAGWARKEPDFVTPLLPDEELSAEELIQYRMRNFDRKREAREARKLVSIHVKLDGPIGILHMGDPHVDDDGCDWPTLQRHIKIAQETDGLFAGNVGDFSNNWIGRLARLYSQQSTSSKQAWKLVEWLIKAVPWLYLIGGNHDAWSGDGDPIKWIAQFAGTTYEWNGIRLGLKLPGGRECRVNARHDFAGSSQWNPAHGPQKAAMLGPSDHIYIAGHRHVFGLGVHKQSEGTWSHAIRVGTYKMFDGYADARGWPDHNLPACATLIFPDASPEGFVEVIKDVEFAADYLAFARRRHAAAKTVAPPRVRAK